VSIEAWVAIAEFPSYSVSNRGRVKRNGRILRQDIRHGYKYVTLYGNGKRRRVSVSRLVALTFLPNPLLLPEVNHNSGNKADNRVSNLSWMTQEDNRRHAHSLRLIHKGQRKKRTREIKLQVVLRITGNRISIVK
jgi:hypothetical protein